MVPTTQLVLPVWGLWGVLGAASESCRLENPAQSLQFSRLEEGPGGVGGWGESGAGADLTHGQTIITQFLHGVRDTALPASGVRPLKY